MSEFDLSLIRPIPKLGTLKKRENAFRKVIIGKEWIHVQSHKLPNKDDQWRLCRARIMNPHSGLYVKVTDNLLNVLRDIIQENM